MMKTGSSTIIVKLPLIYAILFYKIIARINSSLNIPYNIASKFFISLMISQTDFSAGTQNNMSSLTNQYFLCTKIITLRCWISYSFLFDNVPTDVHMFHPFHKTNHVVVVVAKTSQMTSFILFTHLKLTATRL